MHNKEIYSEKYFSNLNNIYDKQTFFVKDRMNNVFDLIYPVQKLKILDLGTANGLFAIECAKKGADSIGLDFSLVALNNGKKLADQSSINVKFVCSECSILPFQLNSFDMVILIDLVEHLDKQALKRTISECYRVLKKGGRVAIYTPNKNHIIEQLRKRNFILKSFKGHINLMSMKEIISLIQNNKFTIEKSYYKPSHIPIYNILEMALAFLPKFKHLFRRRICILARK